MILSHHEFFIQVITNKDKTTIRLYPLTDPAVKPLIKYFPANTYTIKETDLGKFLMNQVNEEDYLKKDIIQ